MDNFKKNLLFQGVFIAVIIAVFVVFYFLLHKNITNQVNIISSLQNRKTEMSRSAENLSLLINDWKVAGKYENEVNSIIPNEDDLVLFSKKIEKISKQYNISFNISFGKENYNSNKTGLNSINFSSTINGNTQDIVKFLSYIENNYYSMKINTLDFNRNDSGTVKVFIKGEIFFK